MKTTDLFNKAFERNDMQNFTTKKNNEACIFDVIVGERRMSDCTTKQIHLTNDPLKLLGCGYRIKSSYSPESESFKYLPSFVLQDYIAMLYIPGEGHYYIERNGVEMEAPDYAARAFVMINPETRKILFKMPVYTDNSALYGAFDDIEDQGYGCTTSDTVAPEIHLDVLDLYMAPKTKGMFPKRHIAMCAAPYRCRENYDRYQFKLFQFNNRSKKKAE